jgi:hypothetical protein
MVRIHSADLRWTRARSVDNLVAARSKTTDADGIGIVPRLRQTDYIQRTLAMNLQKIVQFVVQ